VRAVSVAHAVAAMLALGVVTHLHPILLSSKPF
jgi:hypothetical protein